MAKSKYAKVLPGLARLQTTTEPYQQRVNTLKQALAGEPITDIAALYAELRQEEKALETQVKELNLRIEAVTQLLVTSQDSGDEAWGQYGASPNSLRLPSGDTIRVQSEPYGHVVDKEAFRQWCIANGYESQLQLWPTTMNAVTKERLLAGEELPTGVEVFRRDSLRYVPFGQKDEDQS